MNVTHYLRMSSREQDCSTFECLCTKASGVTIIYAMLKSRKEERFFIHFTDMIYGKNEEIGGLSRDGQCCYYTDKIAIPQNNEG